MQKWLLSCLDRTDGQILDNNGGDARPMGREDLVSRQMNIEYDIFNVVQGGGWWMAAKPIE